MGWREERENRGRGRKTTSLTWRRNRNTVYWRRRGRGPTPAAYRRGGGPTRASRIRIPTRDRPSDPPDPPPSRSGSGGSCSSLSAAATPRRGTRPATTIAACTEAPARTAAVVAEAARRRTGRTRTWPRAPPLRRGPRRRDLWPFLEF